MLLKELFETWGKEPLFLAIATSGLDPKKDRVLGVVTCCPETEMPGILLHDTHGDELLKGQKFHQIYEELMNQYGIPTKIFIEILQERFKDKVLLSYNAPFQYSFLSALLNEPSIMIYDLTIIEQAIRKSLAFSEEDLLVPGSFYSACSAHYYPLPVGNIFKRLNVSRQPPPGVLPAELSADVLKMLYNGVSSIELQLLPS